MTKEQAELVGIIMMPFTYGFIGWFTNWVALKMTFYPLKFWGIPPFLGWQGIIPRKAYKMANKSVDVITGKLITVQEIFDRIEPDIIQKELQPMITREVREVTRNVVDSINPAIWMVLPDSVKEEIFKESEKQLPEGFKTIITNLRKNINQYFDLKAMVLAKLSGDNVKLVVDIFLTVGGPEFRFIEVSGLYFGFLLGLVQIVVWYFFPIWWTLPIQGVIVGYVTNWLALEMIFRPLVPKKILGLFTYQGLFLKRQDAVSKSYANFVATKVLTPRNLLEELLFGKAAEEVLNVVRDAVVKAMEKTAVAAQPVISLSVGGEKYIQIKKEIVARMVDLAPKSIEKIEKSVGISMNLEETMHKRMAALPPAEFENVLRSAFQEDEMLLILIGAALGAIVGLGQGFYFLWGI